MPLPQLLQMLLTSSLLVVTSASAAKIPNLITSHSQEILPRQYAIASYEIHIAQAVFSGGNPTLKIELPDGKRLQWDRIAYEPRGPGEALWRGKLPNDSYSEITLTQKNKLVVGRIHFGNKTYTIRPGAAGKHILSLIDTAALPACGNGPEQHITYPKVSLKPKKLHAEKVASTRLDLLSVYTPRVSASLGGQAAAEALIQAAVDNANAAFANSAMDITYRLVNTTEVNYSESTGIDALYWLEANQAVTKMRAQYSADMVST